MNLQESSPRPPSPRVLETRQSAEDGLNNGRVDSLMLRRERKWIRDADEGRRKGDNGSSNGWWRLLVACHRKEQEWVVIENWFMLSKSGNPSTATTRR